MEPQRKISIIRCPDCQTEIKFSPEMHVRVLNADIPDPRQVVDEIRHQVNQILDTVLNSFLLPGD